MLSVLVPALWVVAQAGTTAPTTSSPTTAPTKAPTLSANTLEFLKLDKPGALVWVFLTSYLVAVLGIAIHGFYRKVMANRNADTLVKKQTTLAEDHFVGGREFNPVLLAMTTFATIYSGYTVVGVPGESYAKGYSGYRWLFIYPFVFPIAFFMSRLNYYSHCRRYVSPSDFMVDRYRSKSIRALTSICLVIPALVYVCTQFNAMGNTVEALSSGDIPAFPAAVVFAVIMLLYEIFGGLRGIAYTDALQGGVLFVSFLLFFPVQGKLFGGTPVVARTMSRQGRDAPLDVGQQTLWMNFLGLMVMAFMLNPQLLVRYQAGRTPKATKWTMAFVGVAAWITMLCSALTGLCAWSYFGEGFDVTKTGAKTFGNVVLYVIQQGAFYNILGSLMLSASVAAFMSTADSALHAASACLTMDLFYPVLENCIPDATQRDKTASYIGYSMSTLVAILALIASQTNMSFSALITIQNALLMICTPGFVLGFLWKGIKPIPVLVGMVVSLITTIAWQCKHHEGQLGACQPTGIAWYGPIKGMHPAIFCFFLNMIIVVGGSFIPSMPNETFAADLVTFTGKDDPKVETFPMAMVGMDLSQTGGPKVRPWYFPQCIIWWFALLLTFFEIPWYWGPEYHENYEVKERDYYPAWLVTAIMVMLVQSICFLVCVTQFWSIEPYQGVAIDMSKPNTEMADTKSFPDKPKTGTTI